MTLAARLRRLAPVSRVPAALVLAMAIAGAAAPAMAASGGDSLAERHSVPASKAQATARATAAASPQIALRQPAQAAAAAQAHPPVGVVPAMRWGSRGSDTWTRQLLAALDRDGDRLIHRVPADVAAYCPGYTSASVDQRRAFWAGLVSSIAKHESTWNPRASGGGGKWLGLMQIAPSTWRAHGCNGQIMNGGDNLSCAVRIMAKQVGRDGVIAGSGARGVGRDWAPMRSGSKRADIAGWTRQQAYCGG